jgi:O-antigen/teichoic acid export membrane protein
MPIVIMDITILLYNWTDTFVLAYFRPTWEVSCYNIAFGLVNMVMFIIISVSTTLFPIFSREHALKNEESQKKIYEKVVKLVTVIVYPLLIFIVAFAPVIILVYGVEYLPALSPLLILVIWGFFRPVGNIGSGLLTAKGRQKLVMKITASTAVLNFILNVILIPAYHMEGAAVATTIAFIFGSVAIYLVLRKDYKIVVDGSYVSKSLAASILAGVLGWGVYSAISSLPRIVPEDFSLIILIVKLLISFLIAGIVYLVILKYINIFSKDEFEIIEKLAAEYWVLRPIVSLIK